MNVLGVNGWPERSHDAAACLMCDGNIVAMAEEERFTRQKRAYDRVPIHAAAFCLSQAHLTPADLDLIVWGWDYPRLFSLHGREFPYTTTELNQLVFPTRYYGQSRLVPVEFIGHHLAHAMSAYAACGFDHATVVVIDGQGEDESTSVWRGANGKLSKVWSLPSGLSLGYFYGAATSYLGFSRSEAGKTMGLAGYGASLAGQAFFRLDGAQVGLDDVWSGYSEERLDEEEEIIRGWLQRFTERWGNSPMSFNFDPMTFRWASDALPNRKWCDIAATLQQELERVYCWIAGQAITLTGVADLALAGGVALNCSVNGLLRQSEKVGRLFIQPAAYDAGAALGAALWGSGCPKIEEFSPYLGPEFTAGQIREFLSSTGLRFSEPADLQGQIAEELLSGRIVGWFQGRQEIGPRALGARSLLADPRTIQMRDRLNLVKGRELWRPLAPLVREAAAPEFFSAAGALPYMLERTMVREQKRGGVPAVVHVDGSARPQTVTPTDNAVLHRLLKEWERQTGVPMLINTSFNTEAEPIVCSPADALRTFAERGINSLALGPFLVRKENINERPCDRTTLRR